MHFNTLNDLKWKTSIRWPGRIEVRLNSSSVTPLNKSHEHCAWLFSYMNNKYYLFYKHSTLICVVASFRLSIIITSGSLAFMGLWQANINHLGRCVLKKREEQLHLKEEYIFMWTPSTCGDIYQYYYLWDAFLSHLLANLLRSCHYENHYKSDGRLNTSPEMFGGVFSRSEVYDSFIRFGILLNFAKRMACLMLDELRWDKLLLRWWNSTLLEKIILSVTKAYSFNQTFLW